MPVTLHRWTAACVTTCACWFAGVAMAYAYSIPSRFGVAAAAGGGGGRYFTGSLLDGYTCKACHVGSTQVDWSLEGLPGKAGFEPGKTYEVSARWADVGQVGFVFEALTVDSVNAGTLSEIDLDQLDASERCGDGSKATILLSTQDDRRIMSLLATAGCGAKQSRFRWTAPSAEAPSPVWLSAGTVRGDGSGTPDGDAFSKSIELYRVASGSPEATVAKQTCSVSSMSSTAWWMPLPIFCYVWRRKCRLRCASSHFA